MASDADLSFESRTTENNVLLIDVVLDVMFNTTVLDVEDLKQCRLVCRKWKSLCEPVFKRRAIVAFRLCKDTVNDPRSIETTMIYRNKVLPPNRPFQAFRFEDCIPYSPPIFEDIIKEHEDSIQELEFKNLKASVPISSVFQGLFNPHQLQMHPISESRLGLYNLSPLIGPNISKLTVKFDNYPSFFRFSDGVDIMNVKLTLECLASIKYLSLTNCAVLFNRNNTISPIELLLNHVTYFDVQGREILEGIVINHFLDTTRLKTLTLKHKRHRHRTWLLDIGCGDVALDMLTLHNIDLLNWDKRTWTTKKLILDRWPHLPVNGDLVIQDDMMARKIELHSSTHSLKTISPPNFTNLVLKNSNLLIPKANVSLQQLKNLTIFDNFHILRRFWGCSGLTAIQLFMLEPKSYGVFSRFDFNVKNSRYLKLKWVPPSVKRLLIQECPIVGDDFYKFETLIALDYHWSELKELLSKIKTNNLIISLSGNITNEFDKVMTFLLQLNLETLAIGEFSWNSDFCYKYSVISKYVKQESKYYLFERNIGKAINRTDFNKLKTLE